MQVYAACGRLAALRLVANHGRPRMWPPTYLDASCVSLLRMRPRILLPPKISAWRRCPTSLCRHTAQEQHRELSCQRAEQHWAAHERTSTTT